MPFLNLRAARGARGRSEYGYGAMRAYLTQGACNVKLHSVRDMALFRA